MPAKKEPTCGDCGRFYFKSYRCEYPRPPGIPDPVVLPELYTNPLHIACKHGAFIPREAKEGEG